MPISFQAFSRGDIHRDLIVICDSSVPLVELWPEQLGYFHEKRGHWLVPLGRGEIVVVVSRVWRSTTLYGFSLFR